MNLHLLSWLLVGIGTTTILKTPTVNARNSYPSVSSWRKDDITPLISTTTTTKKRSIICKQNHYLNTGFILPFKRTRNKQIISSSTTIIASPSKYKHYPSIMMQASVSSSPDNNNRNQDNNPTSAAATTTRRDILTLSTHLLTCLGTALTISTYEDYDCANLKSGRSTLRSSAIKGLGRGSDDRLDGLFDDEAFLYYKSTAGGTAAQSQSSSGSVVTNMREVKSYNEIMEYHRNERVKRWTPFTTTTTTQNREITEEKVKQATKQIYNALFTILQLKELATNYEWDEMTNILRRPVLTLELERSCEVLRSAKGFLEDDGRMEIGFDWGSCAWRHCGAQADAQEAIAELYNYVGLFEPYECLFVLDIIERSLRDILIVVPKKYHDGEDRRNLKEYVQYQPVNPRDDGYRGDDSDSVDTSSIDEDYLEALSGLKSDLSSSSE